jgi:hypothetical protein
VTGGLNAAAHDESSDGEIVQLRHHGTGPTLLDEVVVQLEAQIQSFLPPGQYMYSINIFGQMRLGRFVGN